MTLDLAGYRDVVLVGEGGLGRVYRATRRSTGGLVAIKELRDIAEASPAWHRARRELEAMLRLKGHPYVVSVEEIIDGPNGPCLVMEYVPGGSLMDRLGHGPLSAPEVVLVGQQIAQALLAAHQVGMIHRDVKPHNVLVGQFGQVKVCDFGIAALARGGLQTQTQALTLAYASPEALDGDGPIGPPADVFSFGATMSHLMTGRKPSLQERLGGASLPLQAQDPALAGVVAVVNACQAHRAEDRPTMAVVAATFDQAAADLGTRRLTALAAPGDRDDRTVVRPLPPAAGAAATPPTPSLSSVPPLIPPPSSMPSVPFSDQVTYVPAAQMPMQAGLAQPVMASPTMMHPTVQQPISQQQPVMVLAAPPARSSATAVLWGALTAGLVIAAVAITLLVRSGGDGAEAADPTQPLATAAPAATQPATTPAPAVATTVAVETVPVTVPATTPPVTVAITLPPTVVPMTTLPPVTPAPVTPTTLPGDLGVSVAMAQPVCDGSYVTMLGAAVVPENYAQEIQRFLDIFPGSGYMLNENTCSSLRGRMDNGALIYQAFYGPFVSLQAACDARSLGDGEAYVRVLDNVTRPGTALACPA